MTILDSIVLWIRQVALRKQTVPGSSGPVASGSNSTAITVDPQFIPAQMQEINSAMDVIIKLFGGAEQFYVRTGIPNIHFKCTKELSCAASNAVSCYVGNGVIEMSAAAFNPAPLVSGWYIAHEVGHAFDFSRSRGNPRLYRSQAFVEHFVPKSWWRRLLGLPVGKIAVNVGYQSEKWKEVAKESGTSIRGQLNSAEDFADTFAVIYAVTVIQGSLPYRSFNSPWRYDTVKTMIQGDLQP
jgi:hypothetical protein